ncbi:MAG: lysoplasmalogenase [Proteobacteria bacterium]|nr:lysoplasmalogenase [Pseudomonadota bacterium]MBU1388357.1 lysoplasmalogenase [Pseudomonadota bacterium]MBU1542819.1 lysoplasmalogenase [Pseudomonadota bacterium]MBU2429232.1 lysoplasmalogenase [Pseudomonadota bacterium]MBU2481849.1 lysoplasmalogenase [Pseudomonadota bacterium]
MKNLNAVYILFAILFISLKLVFPDTPFTVPVKVVPALTLACALYLVKGMTPFHRAAMVFGAVFCAAGDAILDIDRVGLFVPGLVAFLLGHIAFACYFALNRDKKTTRMRLVPLFLILPVTIGIMIFPGLGSLTVPVMAYLIIISLMTVLAILSTVNAMAVAGSVIFVVSDAMIALAKFVFDGQPGIYLSLPAYFLGLYLLGFGVIREYRGKSHS